jgi:hypothetical protein
MASQDVGETNRCDTGTVLLSCSSGGGIWYLLSEKLDAAHHKATEGLWYVRTASNALALTLSGDVQVEQRAV